MSILNEMAPEKKNLTDPSTQVELDGAKLALDATALALLLEELKYDEKCLSVYFTKLSSYHVRLSHQKDEWVQKRMERAKSAVNKWFDAKAGLDKSTNNFQGFATSHVQHNQLSWHIHLGNAGGVSLLAREDWWSICYQPHGRNWRDNSEVDAVFVASNSGSSCSLLF